MTGVVLALSIVGVGLGFVIAGIQGSLLGVVFVGVLILGDISGDLRKIRNQGGK